MSEIVVGEQEDGSFAVEISGPGISTRHLVVVPVGYPVEIGCGDVPTADLVRDSFAFLLEREPPTSILRRFRLDEISRYFPEYPEEIRRRSGGRALPPT
jgi:hypothetical protein